MTVPEHFYGLILTGMVILLLAITLLKVWIFFHLNNLFYKKEIEWKSMDIN